MMFRRRDPDARVVSIERPQEATLEQLWQMAEQAGRIEVDHDFKTSKYRVQIMFDNSAGSRIYATGIAEQIRPALCRALDEVARLW